MSEAAESETPPRNTESQAQSSDWMLPQEQEAGTANGVFPYQDLQTMMLTIQQQQLYHYATQHI